jgi:hypothetical protein
MFICVSEHRTASILRVNVDEESNTLLREDTAECMASHSRIQRS